MSIRLGNRHPRSLIVVVLLLLLIFAAVDPVVTRMRPHSVHDSLLGSCPYLTRYQIPIVRFVDVVTTLIYYCIKVLIVPRADYDNVSVLGVLYLPDLYHRRSCFV